MDELMTIQEAADRLGVSHMTIRRRVQSGEWPGKVVDDPLLKRKQWYIDRAFVEARIKQAQPITYTQAQPHAVLCESRVEYNAGDEHPGA